MLRRLAAALGVCLLALLALSAAASDSASAVASTSAPSSGWIVLIDAGSTGSRAHCHQYSFEAGRALPVVGASINRKIKPGLSSYAKNPPAASESIADLLAFIKETIPRDRWTHTPIHLHATAGLRSVTPLEAHAILEVVRDSLESSGFRFERSWAKVISGEQEGLNGWMAVNYLLGVFEQPAGPGGAPPTTTGVVEMGGSSMQITFAPSGTDEAQRKHLTPVHVAGHTYHLYTHSFLQYGLQAAEKLYQRLAMDRIEEGGNPCYPRSYRHSSVGDFGQCTALLELMVDTRAECAHVSKSCSFNGVFQPKIQKEHFVAIENFYYTAKFFGTAQNEDGEIKAADLAVQATPSGVQLISALRAKGAEFCNKPWTTLVEEYAGRASKEELASFCFSAAYQSVVLESGFGFRPASATSPGANLRVARTIGGVGIEWELGATVLELLAARDASTASKQAARDAAARIDYLDPGLPLPPVTLAARDGSAASYPKPHPAFCYTCMGYTLLVAAVAVLAYLGWLRYANSKRSAANLTAYSQAAFNRV